jgi:sugar phosphate isomerase/epimerase
MRFAMVVTTADSQFSAVALRGDLGASFSRVRKLGYQGVELSFREPAKVDAQALRALLEKHELEAVALATGRSWGEDRLSFTNPDAAVRQQADIRIGEYLQLAAAIDAMVILGLMRGRIGEGVRESTARRWARDSVRRAADAAAKVGVRLVIEPINRYETNFLCSVQEALEFLAEVERPNVGILADTFHMNIEDVSIARSLERARKHLFHVHVADSNRWAPGCGHLDFAEVFTTLRRIRYDGYVSVECLPKPDAIRCPRIALKTLKRSWREAQTRERGSALRAGACEASKRGARVCGRAR